MKTENIPQTLKARPQWVLWKVIQRNGEPTKVPFQITGAEAKSNEPMTWNSFDAVLERHGHGGYDGIGYMFSEHDEFVGIDLDGCRNPENGEWSPWAREVIEKLNSYSELSPSGSGCKVFIRAKPSSAGGKNIKLPDMPVVCAKKPGIEVYSQKRYFAVTGKRLKCDALSNDIEPRQEELEWLLAKYTPKRQVTPSLPMSEGSAGVIGRAAKYLERMPGAVSGSGGHNTAFHAACVLCCGFSLSASDAWPLLAAWNTRCVPPWSDSELRHKLADAEKAPGPRGYLRDAKQEDWHRVTVPEYRDPRGKPEVRVTTLQGAAHAYLDAVTSGSMKLIDLGLPDLDYAIGGGVEAGEMIIIAGRPGHGKSAAAQQVCDAYTRQYGPALFVSEEMSNLALGKRAIQFASDIPAEHWPTRNAAVAGHVKEHFAANAPLYIVEQCRTVDRVAEQIETFVKEKGIGLAVVDYAQLLAGRGAGRYEEITNVSITLKHVANVCKIPLLVLCQMSRAIEGRGKFVPVMSDLKESGQLEQDADVIVFVVWPHRLDSTRDPHEFQFFVGKNRNRPINMPLVKCRFLPSRQMLTYETGGAMDAAAQFAPPDWSDRP